MEFDGGRLVESSENRFAETSASKRETRHNDTGRSDSSDRAGFDGARDFGPELAQAAATMSGGLKEPEGNVTS